MTTRHTPTPPLKPPQANEADRGACPPRGDQEERTRALAQSLDCLTEQDLCDLYGVTRSTAESWRKRGKGPSYILAGNRYLYPRASVAADLQARVRERAHVPASELL